MNNKKMFAGELLRLTDPGVGKKRAPSSSVGIRLNAITIFAFGPIAPFYGFLRSRRQLKWRSLTDVFTGRQAVTKQFIFSKEQQVGTLDKCVHNSALTTMCRKHFIIQNFTADVT